MNNFIRNLKKSLSINDSRVALQRAYLAVVVGLFATSAIISLLDSTTGRQVLFFAALAALIFFANAVVWALSQALLVSLEPKSSKKSSK